MAKGGGQPKPPVIEKIGKPPKYPPLRIFEVSDAWHKPIKILA